MVDYETLIERVKHKDEIAFDILYEDTRHVVYAVIMTILKDRNLSEDAMQEVYMKMLKSIHTFHKGSQFKNWLYSIARNHALDIYRKRGKETLVDEAENTHLFQSRPEDPIKQMRVEKMLLMLEEEERLIVVLKAVEDMKFKDIAKVVDKPLGTVLWLYQRAIKKMKSSEEGSYE